MAQTPDGRAFVELDIRAPDGSVHPFKIHHDDEASSIEQQILSTSPLPSSTKAGSKSNNQKLSRNAERAIHEAILDATRMELVQTAHERDNNIDQRLQRYRFLKERNQALTHEVHFLTQKQQHEKRYALDVMQSPSRAAPTMLRQVAVESQRRELKVMDQVRSLENECTKNLQRAMQAESKVRILEAQIKASRSLDLRHAAGGAEIGQMYGNIRSQNNNFILKNQIETLQREKLIMESKLILLESQQGRLREEHDRERADALVMRGEAAARDVVPREVLSREEQYHNMLERARREVKEDTNNDDMNRLNMTDGKGDAAVSANSSSAMEISSGDGGAAAFHRVSNVHAHHELATLKEELRRVLTEFDQSVLDNQIMKKENFRLMQSLQRR